MHHSKPKFDDYQKCEKLGEGTYGTVYRVVDKSTGVSYAMKSLKMERETDGVPSTAMREIALLKELDHPNIVKLHHVFVKGYKKISLLFEYIDQDLKKLMDGLDKSVPIPEDDIKSIMYQLLISMAYCHSQAIIHRDLKPNNILITESGIAKVADFGLARGYSLPFEHYTHEVVTLWYRAPEILLGDDGYFTAVDIWSIGIIMFELFQRKVYIAGESEISQIFDIFRLYGTPTEETWPGVSSLRFFKKTFPKFKKGDLRKKCSKMSDEA